MKELITGQQNHIFSLYYSITYLIFGWIKMPDFIFLSTLLNKKKIRSKKRSQPMMSWPSPRGEGIPDHPKVSGPSFCERCSFVKPAPIRSNIFKAKISDKQAEKFISPRCCRVFKWLHAIFHVCLLFFFIGRVCTGVNTFCCFCTPLF